MRKLAKLTTAVFAATALLGLMPPETAQAFVAYVASNGSDANNCTHSAPCQTFTRAIAVTNPFGQVSCVDQLGPGPLFPSVTISKSVTIDCKGVYGAAETTGTGGFDTGFIINGPGIIVTLRGLNISGVDLGNHVLGNIGINIQQAASVLIEDCAIRGFTSNASQGVRIAPTTVSVSSPWARRACW
jgi:hypothetical protein